MEDLNSLLKHFLKGICPTKKQDRGELMGSHVCTIVFLNSIISYEELGSFKKPQLFKLQFNRLFNH